MPLSFDYRSPGKVKTPGLIEEERKMRNLDFKEVDPVGTRNHHKNRHLLKVVEQKRGEL